MILEKLCGLEISSTQVSNAAKLLDEELDKWRNRPLSAIPFLQLDARYEKVRQDGVVRSCAVLIATGVTPDGKRTVLGTSVSLGEAEVHWREFLLSLKKRGLHGVRMITSDDHAGLKAARESIFPSVPWQRCQTHLQQNAAPYVPKLSMRKEVANDIRSIFNAPNLTEAERMLEMVVEKYKTTAYSFGLSILGNWFDGIRTVSIRFHFRLKKLNYNLKSRWGSFDQCFWGDLVTFPTFPGFQTEFEIGVEFMPTVWTTHEHSPNICRDTKRLMTRFAIFDDVIFHRYCIGRRGLYQKRNFQMQGLKARTIINSSGLTKYFKAD